MGFSNGISEPIEHERIERDPDMAHDAANYDEDYCMWCSKLIHQGRHVDGELVCTKCFSVYSAALAKAQAFLGLPPTTADALDVALTLEPRIPLREEHPA